MATTSTINGRCHTCDKTVTLAKCSGCDKIFCHQHIKEHRQELLKKMEDIGRESEKLRGDLSQQDINKTLLGQIKQWEYESIEKIRSTADQARTNLKQLVEKSNSSLSDFKEKLTNEIYWHRDNNDITENKLNEWVEKLEELRRKIKSSSKIELLEDDSSSIRLIEVKKRDKVRDKTDSSSRNAVSTKEKQNEADVSNKLSQDGYASTQKPEVPIKMNTSSSSQSSSYPSMTFGLDQSNDRDMKRLLKNLMLLSSMDKHGPMSGRCSPETNQMERFLTDAFAFKNIPGEYIVQGVKSFRLDRRPELIPPDTVIHFPYKSSTKSFMMTAKEVVDWQHSYKVYTSKGIQGMNNTFLYHALQGRSKDGEEAFLMKFVVRISTCPILMEFDAKIIPRDLDENWPNLIKLVSVTGIDFAGRKHDVNDILYYVANWRDVFMVDSKTDMPMLRNDRDFGQKRGSPPGKLHEDRLLTDLKHMARLRLRACDKEGVQVVVETGIGLGVFSGRHIGIDGNVRLSSALAIRTVLEEDGPSYENIRAIVFALPIIDDDRNSGHVRHCFTDFVEQFQEPHYNGRIPVLIADQDMHRLTVAIARLGFVVSQLNPADSHGVFGEYWQNRGPAVEEKLALTTLGLLVQHHLINREVLDPKNYHLI